jgi:hypothetical protein
MNAFGCHRQEIVRAHQPRHALVVHQHSTATEFGAHPAVAVTALVLGEDLLDRRPHRHIFFDWFPLLQRPVESRAAHPRQLTHPLDTQLAFAATSSPQFGRRCRLARLRVVLLASSLDFLQGTFEKIGFQRFVRHQPLQLRDLEPEFTLLAVLRRNLAVIHRLQTISPFVQQALVHAESR